MQINDTAKYQNFLEFIVKNNDIDYDDLAELISNLYRDKYKCSNIKNSIWYKKNENETWNIIENFNMELDNILIDLSFYLSSLQNNFWQEVKYGLIINPDLTIETMVKLFRMIINSKRQQNYLLLTKSCCRKMFDPKIGGEKLNENIDDQYDLI
jgi:hypothetical protein